MQDAFEVLEFAKIQEAVASSCRTEIGKTIARSLSPLGEEKLRFEITCLKEACRCLDLHGRIPIDASLDLRHHIELAEKGATLLAEELDQVAHDIKTSQAIKRYFSSIPDAPSLKEKIQYWPDLSPLEEAIHKVIAPDLSIYDKASPELRRIRASINRLEKKMVSELGFILEENRLYLSDATLTLKNGHYVLPVANAHKNKVRGIVQDISNSGETTFIEPERLVQMNNQMVVLKNDEREEIRRLLTELSHQVGAKGEDCRGLNEGIGEMDFIQAKALYRDAIRGHLAELSEENRLYLPEARHPLIDPQKVVANDFQIENSRKVIIISGPNAGGKTVALKTIGLLVLMFECGLPLPTREGAELPYYKRILLDIGDSQSLSDNLSTFSGHIANIASICSLVGGKDLVLLDEVGTGTSPKEGEALAEAILVYLIKKHCTALISSHFEGLKAFAFEHEEVENASMLFDQEKLAPTYKLKIGLPGESYGLTVARRFGIDESIVSYAESSLEEGGSSSVKMAIERLSALAKENEDLKEALQKKQYQLDKKEKELTSKEAVLSTREEKLLEKAKEDKEKMLREAEEKIDELISSLNSPEVKLHQAIAAKKKLEELEEKQKIEEFDGEVAVGDYVKVPAFNIVGKVERIQGNKVYLSTRDGKSLQTSKQSVTKASAPQEERVAMKGAVADRLGFDGVGLELNIIGYHVDEALEAVASYLDKCRLRGLHRVRIIHGYGSGALRQAVHSYLKAHASFVKKYSLGGEYEGGSGATVVELK